MQQTPEQTEQEITKSRYPHITQVTTNNLKSNRIHDHSLANRNGNETKNLIQVSLFKFHFFNKLCFCKFTLKFAEFCNHILPESSP